MKALQCRGHISSELQKELVSEVIAKHENSCEGSTGITQKNEFT